MGAIDTSITFANNQVVTSTNLNDILDSSFVKSDAISGNTLALANGKIFVNALGITSNELGTNSVTTSKIIDAAITTEKINDSSVVTAKINNGGITAEKLNGNQSGLAPIYGARAWGSFNGAAATPITPVASGNVSSISRTATGVFLVTLTEPMPDSNYAVVANATHNPSPSFGTNAFIEILSGSQFNIKTAGSNGLYNSTLINFSVFK